MEPRLFDAHCHLDLMAHPDAVADEATALGLGLFDCGVNPRDFSAANERACRQPGIIAGVGLHPWWLADGHCGFVEVNLLCEVAAQERYIGEVGLDFSARFAGSEPLQIQALNRLCDALVQHPFVRQEPYWTSSNRMDYSSQTPTPPLSSSTGLAVLRTNSSARVMRAVIFPSTNACSHLNEDANTHDRFHSIVYCSRPIHQPNQTQKQAHSRSSDRSKAPQNTSPRSKNATQSILSRRF